MFLPSKTATTSLSPWLLKYNEIANETVLHFYFVFGFRCYLLSVEPHSGVLDRKGTGSQSAQSRSFISEANRASQLTDFFFLNTIFHIFFCQIAVDMERISERRTSPPKSPGKNHLVPNGMRFGEFQQLLKVAARKGAMTQATQALRANCTEEHLNAGGWQNLKR